MLLAAQPSTSSSHHYAKKSQPLDASLAQEAAKALAQHRGSSASKPLLPMGQPHLAPVLEMQALPASGDELDIATPASHSSPVAQLKRPCTPAVTRNAFAAAAQQKGSIGSSPLRGN